MLKNKKLVIPSELAYVLANVILAFAVSMVTSADFGVSMIVAPAYLLHLKLGITFGQAEYLVGAVLFLIFCLVVRKIKPIYFFAFVSCLQPSKILKTTRHPLNIQLDQT